MVSPIVSGKFVELSELLSLNIVQTHLDSDPQLFFNGWLVLKSMSKKPKRRLGDIGAFAGGFFSVLSGADITFFPLLEGSLTLPAVDLADL